MPRGWKKAMAKKFDKENAQLRGRVETLERALSDAQTKFDDLQYDYDNRVNREVLQQATINCEQKEAIEALEQSKRELQAKHAHLLESNGEVSRFLCVLLRLLPLLQLNNSCSCRKFQA